MLLHSIFSHTLQHYNNTSLIYPAALGHAHTGESLGWGLGGLESNLQPANYKKIPLST